MPAPYITREIWPDFTWSEVDYNFGHLQEIHMVVADSGGVQRSIIATFSDHVFTKAAQEGRANDVLFPGCTRNPGFFCLERYSFSLHLPAIVPLMAGAKVWNLTGADRYAQIPVVTQNGTEHFDAIVLTLDRVTGLPFDLHMQVRSAYPCFRKVPDTFGEVKFRHLVRLRMENRHPTKIYERGRRVPRKP